MFVWSSVAGSRVFSEFICPPVFSAASTASGAHPETAAAEEHVTSGEGSAGTGSWTCCTPGCSDRILPWFWHTSSQLVAGRLLQLHLHRFPSPDRPIWAPSAPVSWHDTACRGSSPEVPWRVPRRTAEGFCAHRGFFPQTESPQRAGCPRTRIEVRGAEESWLRSDGFFVCL